MGVNEDSSEYQCQFSNGYANYEPAQQAAAIATWHANAVRIPINQDCWLGAHGLPNTSKNPLTSSGYQSYLQQLVLALNANGIYAILDLHFTSPKHSDGQRQLPDVTSVTFWQQVAAAYRSNPAILFDAFNEPLSQPATPVSWSCWLHGGCTVSDFNLTFGQPGGPITQRRACRTWSTRFGAPAPRSRSCSAAWTTPTT